jgi:mannitol 2-dehydrogenase
VTPLLGVVPGIDLEDYKASLVERFANPAIKDQLSRIAVDGSVRIPKFVLPSVVEQLGRGGPIRLASLTVASWFRCLAGIDERGRELAIQDRRAAELQELARRGGTDPRPLLEMSGLFGGPLAGSSEFRSEIGRGLRSFYERGARLTLTDYVGE